MLNVKTGSGMWKSENWQEGTSTCHACAHAHTGTHLCKHKTALIIGHLLWRLTGCLTTQNCLAEFSIIIKLLSSSPSGDMCKLVSVEQCHAEP